MLDVTLLIFVLCAVLGSLVGFLAGLLGIGGGLIVVPALMYLLVELLQLELSVAMPMAIATSLSTIVLTGLSSSLAHYRLGNVERHLLPWLVASIIVGVMVGTMVASHLPGDTLKDVFGVLVLLIAVQIIASARRVSEAHLSPRKLTAIGGVTGAISSLMGIGGGAIMVPALVWFRLDMKKAIGSAAICGSVLAIFGTLSFMWVGFNKPQLPEWSLGYVYLPATIGIAITSVFTAGIGAKMTQGLPTSKLKKIFAGFLLIVGMRMILG